MKDAVIVRLHSIGRRALTGRASDAEPRSRRVRRAGHPDLKLNKVAAMTLVGLAMPMCYATTGYTARTAPDAVSKSVLSVQVATPEEGALNPADVPAAINRNFPRIIEQNLAARRASSAMAWIDQLSDIELEHLAQLYVNANASMARTGKLLQVAASRLDGVHLGRLSRFFGYADVRAAVAGVAPMKLGSFEASSSVAFAAPVAGAALSVPLTVARFGGGAAGAGGPTTMAGFTPSVSMTIEQLYAGFRSMQVGSMATTGAVYETAAYAGRNLVIAWGIGYGFGSAITYVMQEYEPDFYYGTFVNWVGEPVDWVQNFVLTTFNYGSNITGLGSYQSSTLPTYGTTSTQIGSMGSAGGDWGTESAYETFEGGNGGSCRPGQKCPPDWPQ